MDFNQLFLLEVFGIAQRRRLRTQITGDFVLDLIAIPLLGEMKGGSF
jgi:hypothetical protein